VRLPLGQKGKIMKLKRKLITYTAKDTNEERQFNKIILEWDGFEFEIDIRDKATRAIILNKIKQEERKEAEKGTGGN